MYLNKDDVLSFIKPNIQEQSMTGDEQMMTFGSYNTTKSGNEEMYSLRKSRDVFENYTKTWDR